MRGAVAAIMLLLLAGCGAAKPAPPAQTRDSGERLERAAAKAGLIAPIGDPTGLYVADTDRVCIVPAKTDFRIGAVIDYGNSQGCGAVGTARVDGAQMQVEFGAGCRFTARFEGDRIVFPTNLPRSCDRSCTGRVTLAALTVPRLGASMSEARTMRDPRGGMPCAS
ncbi:conserved exported hypothetical protein [Sphingomonas sp. EC-HK361]|uniref:hypothetical protein n=1 Tax=Sphingomonas sp. EC-HK361 TaxID=2038397 RepID=UPI001253C537|nr:hypothetical protein [Sphingomonas sp. EC-HK361]VVT08862.1 conserved exported hypothetical protein [Sphingomonas sp. EC-HK361]